MLVKNAILVVTMLVVVGLVWGFLFTRNLECRLAQRTSELKHSMEALKDAQEQLIESEKLPALGCLVAGVANEVNTPLGISVTAASFVRDTTNEFNRAFEAQTLTSEQFASLMARVEESNQMLENNLRRASGLIQDFKQTAVDQMSEERSQFCIHQVTKALISSLHPETRKIPVFPRLADKQLTMNSFPSALTQVVSNLILF